MSFMWIYVGLLCGFIKFLNFYNCNKICLVHKIDTPFFCYSWNSESNA